MSISAKVKSKVGALATIGGALVGGANVSADYRSLVDQTSSSFPTNEDPMTIVKNIINVAVAVIGIIAVIMIIIGGYQYATSVGDAGKVKNAKNTIMYGIIGLIIALMAYAIVNFVLSNVFNQSGVIL